MQGHFSSRLGQHWPRQTRKHYRAGVCVPFHPVTHPLRWASPPTAARRPWWCVRRCWHKHPRPRSTRAVQCRQCLAGWWLRETGCSSGSGGKTTHIIRVTPLLTHTTNEHMRYFTAVFLRVWAGRCRKRPQSRHPRRESLSTSHRLPLTSDLPPQSGQPAAAYAPDHRKTEAHTDQKS